MFRPSEELIVVFLVYNPAVTPAKHFDLEVEYHFFRKSRAGEEGPGADRSCRLSWRCRASGISIAPSRSASILRSWGRTFDPAAGQPVMAGQGVPLAGFPEGEYRLSVRVIDLVAGRSLERHVAFTVRQ